MTPNFGTVPATFCRIVPRSPITFEPDDLHSLTDTIFRLTRIRQAACKTLLSRWFFDAALNVVWHASCAGNWPPAVL